MSENSGYSGAAVAGSMFASVMLMIVGVFQFLAGIAAIINDETFVIGQEYVFKLDTTSWGWIHMLLGILLFLAGLALIQGAVWARTVATILAALSAISAFMWLPYQPWWSVLIIVLDIFVIWAVTAHGRDITKV